MNCMVCSQDATHVSRRDGNADLCHTCFLLERRQVANGFSPEHGRLTRAELFAAIQRLNWLYGRGDLIEREMRVFADGRTECTSRLPYGTSKFTARFNGRTVYARGHQTTVKA